jgi:hypothetical protein
MRPPNLFSLLSTEWRTIGASPPACRALRSWAEETSTLAGFVTPADLVTRCNERDAGEDAQRILAALLCRAGADRWAARTFLQAVLPGLAAISRRYRHFSSQWNPMHECVWHSLADLDQQVVATAYELMHALSGELHPWPANKVVDGTRGRVRSYALAELRRRTHQAPDSELDHYQGLIAAPPYTLAEELTGALIDAVERGLISEVDAGMVYGSRVEGRRLEDLARLAEFHVRTAYRRRARAEQVLVADAFGCDRTEAAARLAAAS